MSYDKYEYALSQARCANVFQSEATEEFLRARKGEIWDGWMSYKLLCQLRYEWGIYLRSDLDWDWDVASCLERLFELPERVEPPNTPIVTVSLDAGKADTWNVTTESKLPKEVKFAYRSVTGEMKYRTILFCPSSDNVVSAGQAVDAQDEASAIAPELHRAGGKEAEDGAGPVPLKNRDSTPMRETDSEHRVEQGDEKLGEVTLFAEESSYSAAEEDREGSEIVVRKDSEVPRTWEGAHGPTDSELGDDTANEDALEEVLTDLDVIEEPHADQISICSLN